MKLSVAEFAKSLVPPISRQTLNSHVTRGALIRGADKKIDTEHPKNAAWLKNRLENPPDPSYFNQPATTGTGTPRTEFGNPIHSKTRSPERQSTVPAKSTGAQDRRYRLPGEEGVESSLEGVDIDEALAFMSSLDVRRFSKQDIDKLKNMESLLKTRVERQHKRRELIERTLVQSVFAKLYQVDTNELGVLGSRLAPAVAGVFGVDDPELILKVEHMIDIETMKTKAHIKRVMHDFLTAQGAEGLHD